ALVATQERAWLLLAAQALATRGPALNLTVDGQAVTGNNGPLLRALADGASLSVANKGDAPVRTLTTIAGILSTPDKAEAAGGLTLTRQFKDGKGRPANLKNIRAGDLLVVVLEGKAEQPLAGPLLLIDPLPAGLVVENVRLAGSAQLGDLSWLGTLSEAALVEFRDDRFVAALDGMPDSGNFRLVYLARAVTQGSFTLPSARLDDLIDGSRYARTAAGTLTVLPPAPVAVPATEPAPPAP
ncbi:MAG: alpha-2-macroglobulin family protein, partial [Niveispirillum sp.]|nr:alpha-2-macroglobulin family protein [Niveispirillum sp.]